jgi:hypothetical protein
MNDSSLNAYRGLKYAEAIEYIPVPQQKSATNLFSMAFSSN